jgi:multidrug efflux pump subunit AcrA (membrane-fusion protein)
MGGQNEPQDAAPEDTLLSARVLASSTGHLTFLRILAFIGLAGVVALFLPWQQTVRATGTISALDPADRPQVVQALVGGRIEAWLVAEGDSVSRGDPILRLSETGMDFLDPEVLTRETERLAALRASVAAKRDKAVAIRARVSALQQGFSVDTEQARNRLDQARAAYEAAVLDSSIAVVQRERAEALLADGLRSLAEVEGARLRAQRALATVTELRAAYANAALAQERLEASIAQELARAESELATNESEIADGEEKVASLRLRLANLSQRQDAFVIRAPQDGFVVRVINRGVGEIVSAGAAVATVQPSTPGLAAELLVKAMDLPLLSAGRKVRLQFDGWPALQFAGWPSVAVGTFGGEIAVVDRTDNGQGMYRVLVAPDPDDEPWPEQLRAGSGVYGWAMLDEVRIWFEIWRQLNGFPPSIVLDSVPGGRK